MQDADSRGVVGEPDENRRRAALNDSRMPTPAAAYYVILPQKFSAQIETGAPESGSVPQCANSSAAPIGAQLPGACGYSGVAIFSVTTRVTPQPASHAE